MWFRRSIAMVLCMVLLGGTLVGLPPSRAQAFSTNPNDYFSYSYAFTFSKTTVAPGEAFYVTVSGQATCTQDLPVQVSCRVVSKIIARHQQSGTEVTLNAVYTLSYSDFPRKKGETASVSVQVPLVFPGNAASGSYSVIGQVIEAKAFILVVWMDVSGSIPSQQDMGMVTCSSGGGGGGGGGGGAPISGPDKPQPATDLTPFMKDGVFKEEAAAKSPDGMVKLTIAVGTRFGGTGVVMIEVDKNEEPKPPDAGFLIGKAYNLGPDGATFSQPVRLTFSFDPESLPKGVKKKDVSIAWWNAGDAKWVPIKDCEVDETANTVSGMIDHFTMFGIIAVPEPEPAPVTTSTPLAPVPVSTPPVAQPSIPPPEPSAASFELGDLTVTPALPLAGDGVTVAVTVSNTGDLVGTYEVALTVDGARVESQSVSLVGYSSQQVSFALPALAAGDHTISVNNVSCQFTVGAPGPEHRAVNWWLVAGWAAVGVLAGAGIAVGLARRARGRP